MIRFLLLVFLFLTLYQEANAETFSINVGDTNEGSDMSVRLVQIIGIVTILSIAPSILIMVTSFTRIVTVLSIVRTAIGLQQTPPTPVIMSLALFLTFLLCSLYLKSLIMKV